MRDGKWDVIDTHIYGGGALLAIGLGVEFGFWLTVALGGALLLGIGLKVHWGKR